MKFVATEDVVLSHLTLALLQRDTQQSVKTRRKIVEKQISMSDV